jgi:hypothetical protein
MMQLRVDPKAIAAVEAVIIEKTKQAEVMISPISLSEIAKAVFTITAKKFLQDLAIAARQDPMRYHHLYEWGSTGNPVQKLFIMRRATFEHGNLSIVFIPIQSTRPVPIAEILKTPGPTGKVVSARHIFRDKMKIMENNDPIHIVTKRTVAFAPRQGNQIIFLPKDKIINIYNPGGRETTHALRNFHNMWYNMKADTVVKQSRLIRQIGNRVAIVLNEKDSTKTKVRDTIRQVTSAYSKELSEI